MKLLLVEDEPALLQTTSSFLRQEGFTCEEASTYALAEDKLAAHAYDVVVLDITLPDGNGLHLLSALRHKHPETGILVLSARNALDDKLQGLDLGADDYMTKPFFFPELNSRLNAIIRRRKFSGNTALTFHEISIWPDAMRVEVKGSPVELTNKEYHLLLYFMTNRNRVLTKEAIAEHIWGDSIDTVDSFDFIYTHIKNLRRKVLQACDQDYLQSIYGIGYKFTDYR